LNGSWVAGALMVGPPDAGTPEGAVPDEGASAAAGEVPGSSSAGALLASGASGLTRIVGDWSSSPSLTTNSAGCSSVGPPRGISATARWRPGASDGGGARPLGRAVAAGALTERTALTSVPSSVGRTGRYWPDGHHAHVSSATSPAAPAITSAWRGR
jgi:hypothetical protein